MGVTCACETVVLFGPMFRSVGSSALMSNVGSVLTTSSLTALGGTSSIDLCVGGPNFCRN